MSSCISQFSQVLFDSNKVKSLLESGVVPKIDDFDQSCELNAPFEVIEALGKAVLTSTQQRNDWDAITFSAKKEFAGYKYEIKILPIVCRVIVSVREGPVFGEKSATFGNRTLMMVGRAIFNPYGEPLSEEEEIDECVLKFFKVQCEERNIDLIIKGGWY